MGIAGAGMSGLARILLERGVVGQRVRGARVARRLGAARARRDGPHRALGRPSRRRRHLRLHDRDQPAALRVRRRPRERHAGAAARGRAGRGARRPAHRRDLRHARQDDDDVAADRRRAGVRRRPVLRDRRQPLRDRQERAPRHRRPRDRRGGRERRIVPAHPSGRRDRHQRRGRPSREPRRPRGHLPRVRAVRRPHRPQRAAADVQRRSGCDAHRGARARSPAAGCAPTATDETRTSWSAGSLPVADASSSTCHGHRHRDPARPGRRADRRHMALNATAALAMAAELDLDVDTVVGSWASLRRRAPAFRVARRRRGSARLRRLRAPPDRDRRVARRGEGAPRRRAG